MDFLNQKGGTLIRKKLFTQRFKRTSFVFVLIALLVIPFQNCKKFESNETTADSSSSTGGSNSNSGGSGATVPPDSGAAADDPAVIAAENARQARCKANIKKPIMTNSAAVNNFIFNLKSGLSNTAGDANSAENKDITVDSSKGIINTALTTPQTSGGDGCSYATSLRVDAVNDASHVASLTNAIDFSGNSLVVADATANFNTLKTALTTNPSNNNNNTFATDTLNLKINITNNNNRNARCVEGSVWYSVKIRVSTQGLQNNSQLESDPVYIKANIANSCWIEKRLNGSSAYPLNAKAGSRVAMDGSWAAVLAQADNNQGAVYMFNKDGSGNWNFTQKVIMPDAAAGQNLSNIAIKGSILAVSNASFNSKGKVYIFKYGGSSWASSQQINAYESTVLYQQFGLGLALSSNMLLVGSPSHPKTGAAGSDTGKVYAYSYNSGTGQFDYAQTIEGMNEANYGFGRFILVSGTKMFIGAPDSYNDSTGRLFVFNYTTSWGQEMFIAPPASIAAAAGFGSSAAYNGTALAVGAPLNDKDTNNLDSGSVYYYKTYNGALFHTMNGAGGNFKFGTSLAFTSDSLYVGCTGCGTNQSGVVFRKLISNIESATSSNRDLNAFAQFSHDNTNTESFGQSMTTDGGTTVMIGAPSKDTPNLKSGAAYMYSVR